MNRSQRERYLRHHAYQLKQWKRYAALALIDTTGKLMESVMIQSQVDYHRKQLRLLHLPPALRCRTTCANVIRFPKGQHYERIRLLSFDDQLFGAHP